MKEVCVVGAGVGGLVAGRYLMDKFRVTIYEASNSIGGVWLYNKGNTAGDKHTPMYNNLKTNLPKHLMAFRGLPHGDDIPSFLTHMQVMSYLEKYCDKFAIRRLIKFNTKVISVKPDVSHSPMKWIVQTGAGVSVFDAIALCTGRYDTPHIPTFAGLDTYKGNYIHSKEYSVPDLYAGKSVLVVGAKSSGIDMIIDLAVHGVDVSVSHRNTSPLVGLPPNVAQHKQPIKFAERLTYFEDDSIGHAFDMIIFATGYDTNLQYVDPSCGIATDVLPRPLYRYLINPKYPTMGIFNQCYNIAPFPFTEYQVLYFRDILLGKLTLEKEEVLQDAAEKLLAEKADKPLKYRYALHLDQFPYNAELAGFCGVSLEQENDMEALCELYDAVAKDRGANPMVYRSKEYAFSAANNKFELVTMGKSVR